MQEGGKRTPKSLSMKLRTSSSLATFLSLIKRANQIWKLDLTFLSSSSSVLAEVWGRGNAGMMDCGVLAAIASANFSSSV